MNLKKTLQFFTTLIFILLFVAGFPSIPSRAAALVKIQSVKVTNSPLSSGQTPVLSVLLTNKCQVQYQAFLYSESTKKWDDITGGYLTSKNGICSFTITSKKTVLPGNYKISVWIKKPGTRGIYKNSSGLGYYDSYYCISGYASPIKIKSATVSANILNEGTSPILKIISTGYGMAQYDIFMYSNSTGKWVDLSNGYTAAASVNTIYNFKLNSINETGSYKLSVLVKTAGSPGITSDQGGLGYYDTKYDLSFNITYLPKITTVKINNNPLSDNVIPNLTITTSGSGKVQYMVFANLNGTSLWEDVTGGYTSETDADIPAAINLNKKLNTGTYRLSVWVKRAGTTGAYSNSAGLGSYDGYYCIQAVVSKYVPDNLPKITSVIVNNNPLTDDTDPTLTITSSGTGKVQYRVLANLSTTNIWDDMTGGYTGETDADIPFTLNLNKKLSAGTYKLSIWIKTAGTTGTYSNSAGLGSYDSYYCISQNVISHGIPCIVIDAGHGGNDSGAIGPTGLYEKDVNLNVALKVGEILKNNNINVIYTRDSDSTSWDSSNQMDSLKTRVNISNSNNTIAFVAIHCNSCTDPTVNGIETYVYAMNTTAEKLADNIQNNLVQETSLSDRKVKTDNLYVLVNTTSPAVLTEIGFISNPDEENLMRSDDYLNKVADAIAKGIIDFVNN